MELNSNCENVSGNAGLLHPKLHFMVPDSASRLYAAAAANVTLNPRHFSSIWMAQGPLGSATGPLQLSTERFRNQLVPEMPAELVGIHLRSAACRTFRKERDTKSIGFVKGQEVFFSPLDTWRTAAKVGHSSCCCFCCNSIYVKLIKLNCNKSELYL